MDKISVITICYNSERFIEKTVESVLKQDYSSVEFIIVDGGSTDKTLSIINKYQDNITKIISEPDKGIYDAMNKGVQVSTGEWIIFMNSSDCFYSNDTISNVFMQVQYDEKIQVIYGDIINDYGDYHKHKKAFFLNDITYRMPFCHQAAFVRRNTLLEMPFDLTYRFSADYNQFYNIFHSYGATVFFYKPISIAICDATDSFSRNNIFPMWLEYMKIRSAHKDLRWYWDSFKNWIKITFLGYKA